MYARGCCKISDARHTSSVLNKTIWQKISAYILELSEKLSTFLLNSSSFNKMKMPIISIYNKIIIRNTLFSVQSIFLTMKLILVI